MADDDLAMRLQSLPPELYLEIYNLVFTAAPGEREINSSYKPPKLLAIDRASRELFAKSYYGAPHTTFVFSMNREFRMGRFLRSLQQPHRALIKDCKVTELSTRSGPPSINTAVLKMARESFLREDKQMILNRLEMEGYGLEAGVVRMQGLFVYDGRQDVVEV